MHSNHSATNLNASRDGEKRNAWVQQRDSDTMGTTANDFLAS